MSIQQPRTSLLLATIVFTVALAGCVAAAPPRSLDLNRAVIMPATTETQVDVSGLPGGTAAGVGVGAGAGAGYGALAGGVACLAAGPLAPLCLVAVLPTMTAVGAVSGAAVGGMRADTVEGRQAKTMALKSQLSATTYHAMLAERLRAQLLVAHRKDVAWRDSTTVAVGDQVVRSDRPWLIEVFVDELGTEGSTEFAVRLQTSLRVTRADAKVDWDVRYTVQSETELTMSQWQANESAALNGVLAECIARAANQLATVLAGPLPNDPEKGWVRKSSSCKDDPASWTVETTKEPASKP